jgi:hypothetical protein
MKYLIIHVTNGDDMSGSGVSIINAKNDSDIELHIQENYINDLGENVQVTKNNRGRITPGGEEVIPGLQVIYDTEFGYDNDREDCDFIGYMPYDDTIEAFMFEPNICEITPLYSKNIINDIIDEALEDDDLDNADLTKEDILNGDLFDYYEGSFGKIVIKDKF